MKRVSLDDRQFRRLCTVIGIPQDRLLADCRRAEARVPMKLAVATGRVLGATAPSTLRDVSRQGATLLHPVGIPVDTCLAFFLGGEEEPIRLLAIVTHSKGFADGSALVSVQFTGFIDPRARGPEMHVGEPGYDGAHYAEGA